MEIKDLPYTNKQDYPEIVIEEPNSKWAAILQNLYAGCESETTAVLGYIFDSYITKNKEKEIAKLFIDIAIVEMEHHSKLADAIVKLGGTPYYCNSQGMAFSIKCVNQSTNLKQILLKSIDAEERAIQGYQKAKQAIDNESIQQLLNRIIEDEKLHKSSLESVFEYISFYK